MLSLISSPKPTASSPCRASSAGLQCRLTKLEVDCALVSEQIMKAFQESSSCIRSLRLSGGKAGRSDRPLKYLSLRIGYRICSLKHLPGATLLRQPPALQHDGVQRASRPASTLCMLSFRGFAADSTHERPIIPRSCFMAPLSLILYTSLPR